MPDMTDRIVDFCFALSVIVLIAIAGGAVLMVLVAFFVAMAAVIL